MLKTIKRMLADVRLMRMSDGHVALVRDLGLIKGGRGLRQHEKILSFGTQLVSIPARIRVARARDLIAKEAAPSPTR